MGENYTCTICCLSYNVSRRDGRRGCLYLNTRLGVGAEGNGGMKTPSVLGLNLWEYGSTITERRKM